MLSNLHCTSTIIYLFNIKLVQQYTRKEKEKKEKKNNKRKHMHTEITIKPE